MTDVPAPVTDEDSEESEEEMSAGNVDGGLLFVLYLLFQ